MKPKVRGAGRDAVPVTFVRTLLDEVAAAGEDVGSLLARAGSPFTLADLREGASRQIPYPQFVALYRECITLLSAVANRERNLPPMSKDEVDMLCYCVITCGTLREVIERAARFCAMLGHRAADLSLEQRGDEAVFHMATLRLRDSTSGLLTDLSGLSFYHRLFSWLIGERIPVSGYGVFAGELLERAVLERFFRTRIDFGRADSHFRFPARLLDKPVVRSYQRLVELLSVLPFDQLHDMPGEGQLRDAVADVIAAQLARELPVPSIAQFASLFNLSVATFRRRLEREGTGLGEIKQAVRRELALELLGPAARLKVADVAARLGFSDARAFRRAFLGWHGVSPDAWRRQTGKPVAGGTRPGDDTDRASATMPNPRAARTTARHR